MPSKRRLGKEAAGRKGEADGASKMGPVVVGTDFSGLDTPLLALANLGINTRHAFSADNDEPVSALINHVFNPETMYGDVRQRDNAKAAKVDLFCFGPPCQSWSIQGGSKGIKDDRGQCLLASLPYIRAKRPACLLMENVKNLTNRRNKPHLDTLAHELEKIGYNVSWRVMNTFWHGLPQNRERVILVGVLNTAQVHEFTFPHTLPPPLDIKELLEGADAGTHMPPKGLTKVARKNYKKAKQAHPNGLDGVIIDIDAGSTYPTSAAGYSPCLTASRARAGGFYIGGLNRRMTIREMCAIQGIKETDLYWQGAGISQTNFRRMIGNAMSVNVLERVLPKLLWSARLIKRRPADEWELFNRSATWVRQKVF